MNKNKMAQKGSRGGAVDGLSRLKLSISRICQPRPWEETDFYRKYTFFCSFGKIKIYDF